MQADSLPIRVGKLDLLYRQLREIQLLANECKQQLPFSYSYLKSCCLDLTYSKVGQSIGKKRKKQTFASVTADIRRQA